MKFRFLTTIISVCGAAISTFAQGTFNSSGVTIQWGSASTWTLISGTDADGIPDSNDDVNIISNHNVQVNVGSACNTLTFAGSTSTLSYTGSNTLAVTGDVTVNGTDSQFTGNSNNHRLNIGGNFTVSSGKKISVGGIRLAVTGTTLVAGTLYFDGSNVGNKFFNGTITVAFGGTWDNTNGEDPRVNCDIVNNGSWPAPSGGTARYQVSVNGTSYTYSGTQPINMGILDLTNGNATTITNLTTLSLNFNTTAGQSALDVGNGRTFINGDGVTTAVLIISGSTPAPGTGTSPINNNGRVDFTKANNTVEYSYAGNQNIYQPVDPGPNVFVFYNGLRASASGTKTLLGNTTVTNLVTVSGSAILDAAANTFNGAANLTMTGTSELRLSKIGVSLPEFTGTSNSFSAGTTITLNGAGAQTAKGSSAANPSTTNTYPYQNVTLSGNVAASNVDFTAVSLVNGNLTFSDKGRMNSNPVMVVGGTLFFGLVGPPVLTATTVLNANITVGNIIFRGGTLNYSNRTITINGNSGTWTNNGGATFSNNATSAVVFTTGTNQQITGTVQTVFPNLTINNANGISLNGVDAQVQNTLTLTVGNLVTGSNLIYVNGPVSRTSGFVEGNLQKDVAVAGSTSVRYEVGTGSTYAFVDLVFTSVTVAGTVTVSSTAGDNPDINASNIEPAKSANRWWSITNSGTTFTTYTATFNFAGGVPIDLDAAANPANFSIKRTDGLNWFTTTTGARTGTSTQFTGEPIANLPNLTRQDFQCGEAILTTGITNRLTGSNNWSNKATWIENRTGNITFTVGSTAVVGNPSTLFLSELAVNDVLMLQTTAGIVRGTVQLITDNQNLTLFAPAGATISGGYGRQRVPNLIGDQVTIGNANIADAITDINFDMPGPTTINSLDINLAVSPRNTAQSVTHSVANLLTVQTNVKVNQPGAGATDAWNINAGNATVNGNLTIASATAGITKIAKVVITTGGLTTGNLIFNSTGSAGDEVTAVLDMSGGAGTITLQDQLIFNANTGRLIPGATSTFVYQRSASGQRINFPSGNNLATVWTYRNLTLKNTSAAGAYIQANDDIVVAASTSKINVTGNIRIQTGLMVTSNFTDITGGAGQTFQIDPGATFSMTGSTSTFPTGFATFNLGTVAPFGLVSYEQTAGFTTITTGAGINYGSLQVLCNALTISMPTITIAGHLIVGDGTTTPTLKASGGGGANWTVNNNVTINANATINANLATNLNVFSVGGNWTNNGTFVPFNNAAHKVVFTGAGTTQPQTLGGSSSDTFYNLEVNTTPTSTDLVQLQKSIAVSNIATFTLGGLDLNGNALSLTQKGTGSVVRTGGYVKSENTSAPYGTITWHVGNTVGSFVFPFGKSSTEYIPFTFQSTVAGTPNNGGTISVSTYGTPTNNTPLPSTVSNLNGTGGGNSVVDRFWIITDNNFTTKPTATFVFTAVGGSAPTGTPPSERPGSIANLATVTANPAGIAAQRWNSGGFWDVALSGQTFANNAPAANFFQVTVPGVISFSPWTLVDAAAPLPIQLVSFDAKYEAQLVRLEWKTESELNNDFFTIQKTSDTENFQELIQVKGAGTTITPKKYFATDNQLTPGKWYYRLKQTDFDGTHSYSKLVLVEVPESMSWTVYPNPFNGLAFGINFTQDDLGKVAFIKLQDIEGHELLQTSTQGIKSTDVNLVLPIQLAPGFYIISIAVEQKIIRQKLIVR